MANKLESELRERVKIQEKALQNLADTLRKREVMLDDKMQDVLEELKALKMFLARSDPDFKKEFPEIRKKVKAA